MDRPTKPSGRHAVRLRWDRDNYPTFYRFNFLAIRESLLVPDDSQDVVISILYSKSSAVAEQRLDAGRVRCRHAIRLVRQTSFCFDEARRAGLDHAAWSRI